MGLIKDEGNYTNRRNGNTHKKQYRNVCDMAEHEDIHEQRVFRYINWTTAIIFVIIVAVIFLPIPHGNDKYVDIALGILLGILSSNSGTITGGNPQKKQPTVTQTGDSPTTTVNPAVESEQAKG